MKRRIVRLWEEWWRQVAGYLAILILVGGALWWRLGSLVPGLSKPELVARASSNSFYKLYQQPLFLPHKCLQYMFMRFGGDGAFWMRSASAIFGLLIVIIFYDIVRNWYSRRIALMSSLLLLTSAWFLHFARLGTPEIMYGLSIGLIWIGIRLKSVRAPRIRTILASFALIVASLYVPGLIWLLVPLIIWQRRLVWYEMRKAPKLVVALAIVGAAVSISPLVYGFIIQPDLLRQWLYLPNHMNLRLFWSNAWHLPLWLIIQGPNLPVHWLGDLPLFDIFSVATLGLGVYVLASYRKLDRVRFLVGVVALALILAILNGWIALFIALPAVYMVIAAGVALLLQQWFTVFPRNPLARLIGVVMVSMLILLSAYYNTRHYFVAWPKNSQTQQVFGIIKE